MAASNRGHYKAVDILLLRGANPHMQDNVRSRNDHCIKPPCLCLCVVCPNCLLVLVSNPSQTGWSALLAAVFMGHDKIVLRLGQDQTSMTRSTVYIVVKHTHCMAV